MILINHETPETLLIEAENKHKFYSTIKLLQYSKIIKHYLQYKNYAKVGNKFGYSRSRIQQIVPKSLLLIIKRLKEKNK